MITTDAKSTLFTINDFDEHICSEITKCSAEQSEFWSSPKRNPREFAHSLFQYPAMMVPSIQKKIIDILIQTRPGLSTMVDPFLGAGTTITASMSCGLNCYGQDINPLAILVSKAKTDFTWEEKDLRDAYSTVIASAIEDQSNETEADFPNIKKWFKDSVIVELSKIKRSISRQQNLAIRRILWVTFAEVIRLTSNDRTTTYKLHARSLDEINERNPSPIKVFKDIAQNNLQDILDFKNMLTSSGLIVDNKYVGEVEIVLGDTAKELFHEKGPTNKYDLLVTSPPYGDNTSTITYGQHAYLPLRWINLGDIDPQADESFLRTTQEIDRRSLGGSVITKNELGRIIDELRPLSFNLANIFDALNNKPSDRKARVASFYRDYISSLNKVVSSLSDNAYMIWTLGNRRVGGIEIPNDRILTDLLKSMDVHFIFEVTRKIHYKRMPHKNQIAQMMHAEKILIFRKNTN